jgi:hypothetical protein
MKVSVKQRSSEQSGYIIVCVCIILGLLLSIAAAALDAGNLYLWRVRLEKAARAGVVSGLGYRALMGWQTIYGSAPAYNGNNGVRRERGDSAQIAALLTHVEQVVTQNLIASVPSNVDVDQERSDGNIVIGIEPNAYNPLTDSITISLTYRVPTFLAGRIQSTGMSVGCAGGDGTRCTVATTQTAALQPATIAMILDTSGSMICDDDPTDPNCTCRGDPANPCEVGRRVIDRLVTAAQNFQRFFNPFRDRITIVPFNIAARVAAPIMQPACLNGGAGPAPMSFGATQAIYDRFYASIGGRSVANNPVASINGNCVQGAQIQGLVPFSNTNPCDGFLRATTEVQAVVAADQAANRPTRPFYVFFTDGAPNAMRGTFPNQASEVLPSGSTQLRTTLALQPNFPTGPYVNDWYQYSLEWRDSTTTPPGAPYRGPGPLVHASAAGDLFNFQIGASPTGTPIVAPSTPTYGISAPVCGDVWPEAVNFERALNGNLTVPVGRRGGCLTNLSFTLPGLAGAGVAGVPFSNSYTTTGGVTVRRSNVDQLHYFCPIEVADWARRVQQATVFSIGLGRQAEWCGDPAQDADNHFTRKDNFLHRIAFSQATLASGFGPYSAWAGATFDDRFRFSPRRPVNITTSASCPANSHSFQRGGFNTNQMQFGYTGGRDAADLPQQTIGQYYGTQDATQLLTIFTQTAKQILLRLGT